MHQVDSRSVNLGDHQVSGICIHLSSEWSPLLQMSNHFEHRLALRISYLALVTIITVQGAHPPTRQIICRPAHTKSYAGTEARAGKLAPGSGFVSGCVKLLVASSRFFTTGFIYLFGRVFLLFFLFLFPFFFFICIPF